MAPNKKLNVSRLVLQLPLPNPLKQCVKSRMKMHIHLSDQQFYCQLRRDLYQTFDGKFLEFEISTWRTKKIRTKKTRMCISVSVHKSYNFMSNQYHFAVNKTKVWMPYKMLGEIYYHPWHRISNMIDISRDKTMEYGDKAGSRLLAIYCYSKDIFCSVSSIEFPRRPKHDVFIPNIIHSMYFWRELHNIMSHIRCRLQCEVL